MSERTKKNFKVVDLEDWDTGLKKCEEMRRLGYDVDWTRVLNFAVTQFAGETIEQSCERLGIPAGEPLAHAWRRPHARPVTK